MRNRRKKQFIDSAVQGALARRIVLHWLLFLAMACIVLPIWQLICGKQLMLPFAQLLVEGWISVMPILFILLAMLPLFVWDTVKLSQRFAGPLHQLHNPCPILLVQMLEGDLGVRLQVGYAAIVKDNLRGRQSRRAHALTGLKGLAGGSHGPQLVGPLQVDDAVDVS